MMIMRRKKTLAGAVTVVLLALGLVAASIATAAKPVRSPYLAEPITLDGPGTRVCAFPVELSQPDSKYTLTAFGTTRLQITGSGHDRARNIDTGASVTLPTSGKLTQTVLPDGTLRFQVSGRTLFYFFEGDFGPFEGQAGPDGALYYVVGHVDETLNPVTGFVTSFKWSGKATELCSLID